MVIEIKSIIIIIITIIIIFCSEGHTYNCIYIYMRSGDSVRLQRLRRRWTVLGYNVKINREIIVIDHVLYEYCVQYTRIFESVITEHACRAVRKV